VSVSDSLRRWRERLFAGADPAARREVARLDEELAQLRHELNELRGRPAAPPPDEAMAILAGRVEKLERLTVEHPEVASVTAPHPAFPSPAVSVITPTWNRADLVGAAIRSVQAQRFADWEMLVIDDGSTDNTEAVMAGFAADPRVRFVRREHAGQCAARNHALSIARGAIVAYLDSDNVWYPGYLAAAVATYASRPEVDCAYGAMVTDAHWDKHILFEPFDRKRLEQANFIGMSTFSHRRALYERFGGFDETLTTLEDWDLILRYSQHAPAYRLPFLAVRYRVMDRKRVTVAQGRYLERDAATIRAKWTG